MDKKIPKVFANRIDRKIENNAAYSITRSDEVPFNENNVQDINSKINQIFKSTGYVYKADVDIKLPNKTVTKRIIGKKNGYIITIDNEMIKISDILDINMKWIDLRSIFFLMNLLLLI